VIALTLAEISAITGGTLTGESSPDVTVTGPVVIDSRRAEPGSLFAALPGEHADGHDFAAAAVAKGAVAVLGTRQIHTGVPRGGGGGSSPLAGQSAPVIVVPDVLAALAALAHAVLGRLPGATVVGITGSSGKTSTKDLTAQVLERLGPTVATEGSLNNEIGLPLTVLLADSGTRYLVLEMAARGVGHIAYLCGIAPPKIGAVLNVGRAHTGEFGSLEGIAKAKGELPEAVGADGVAVLNADDPRVIAMADRTAARIVRFGAAGEFRAEDVTLDELSRASFRLVTPDGTAPVALRLHGAHHVANALAAAAIAAQLGMATPDIADALSAATARSKKRMELRERPDGVLIVNDAYNANPDSMKAAIEALAHMTGGGSGGRRGIAVLGHMAELGDIDAVSHAEAGLLAARAGVAALVAVGEGARPVLDGARGQPEWQGEAIAVADPGAAVAALRNVLRPGDVVLVKASKAAGLWEVADGLLAETDR
jgi:UDP-N-acetylmuramoyl-tripeptide--D-alanyl-D-alanine ligase